jgi:hypothetical protein
MRPKALVVFKGLPKSTAYEAHKLNAEYVAFLIPHEVFSQRYPINMVFFISRCGNGID